VRQSDGFGELEIFSDLSISLEEKVIFSKYVHDQLRQKAPNVMRHRRYVCDGCGTAVADRTIVMKRLKEGKKDIICQECEDRIPLWDALEEKFSDPEFQKQVRQLAHHAQVVLDNESKERVLVGEVMSTVALAGQIARETTVSDWGIDMEIEFKTEEGHASGRRLYLQLKSGDSHLRDRQRDGAKVFKITNARHTEYWTQQAYPVMLVVRFSDGEIQWMDVSGYLRRESQEGKREVKEIRFFGERFDVESVRRWRKRELR
jgi:uncharacterized protein YlaI